MHGVVTTTGWRAGHRETAPEKKGNFTPANPRASGTIVWCHDISGVFDWVRGWELEPFIIVIFYLAGQPSQVGLGNLWALG